LVRMFGDNDPEIVGFFDQFLGPAPRRASPAPPRGGLTRREERERRKRPDISTDGLAIGLAGAAAILEQGSAPRGVRLRAERTEAFNQMLEDMANDIMENGLPVEEARSVSPTPRDESEDVPEHWRLPHIDGPVAVGGPDLPAADAESDDESDEEQPSNVVQAQDCTPEEFEDLPRDAWKFPDHKFTVTSDSFRMTTDSAWPERKVPASRERKVAHSPPPPNAVALAASSKLKGSDLSHAPTPARRMLPGGFRAKIG